MIYTVIRQLQKEAIPVQQSCDLLAVSRSGFYTAQHHTAKHASCKASVHLKAAFMACLSSELRKLATRHGHGHGQSGCANWALAVSLILIKSALSAFQPSILYPPFRYLEFIRISDNIEISE